MIEQQLEQYYESFRKDSSDRNNTRKWCFTLWVAILGFIGSGVISFERLQVLVLLYSPIIIFWMLEGFQHSFTYRNMLKAKDLETKLLNKKKIEVVDFYINYRLSIPLKTKLQDLCRTCFTSEVILAYYLTLMIGSTIFYFTIY